MAKTLNDLPPAQTLYQALRETFSGSASSDYIFDKDKNLTISESEDKKFKEMQVFYSNLYISAYQAKTQCEDLKTCFKQTHNKKFNAGENMVIEEIGPIAQPSEISLRKCYFTWLKMEKSFGIVINDKKVPNYRSIQKDAMRSYLMYMLMLIKKYLV